MLAAMCHAYQWEMGAEQGEEGEATADKDGNSSTLRRKLFGQPERQVMIQPREGGREGEEGGREAG